MTKKIILFLIIFTICFMQIVFSSVNGDAADKLADLGLFKGTGNGYELDKNSTRAEAVTMLVRLLGKESEAMLSSAGSGFDDVPSGVHWAAPYVGYCSRNGITKGTSDTEFSPESTISSTQFITFLVRSLGYQSEPETAYKDAIENGLISSNYAAKLNDSQSFLRDDMVYLSYRALKAQTSENITLAEKLIQQGVFTAEQAQKAGVLLSDETDFNNVINELLQ